MILRFLSLLLVAYVLGFALFGVTLSSPAPETAPKTDAIVVLTGGSGRIEHAVERLAAEKAERLLIAGADPLVTDDDLVERLGGHEELVDCCIDLGSESVDTKSNAEEAKRWLADNEFTSVRLVTSDWHMRRAAYEFRRELGPDFMLLTDAVPSRPGFMTLFAEYNKYVLRRLGVMLGI